MQTVSPVSLIQPLQMEAEKENRLIIELPGEELPVLKALQQAELLQLFSQLNLYCGREALYEGSEPAARVLEWLREIGFDLVDEDDSQDPDRPCWILHCNALKLRDHDLQRQLDKLIEENEQLLQQAADLQAQTKLLTEERDSHIKLANEFDSWVSDLTELSNDRQAQLEKVTNERDEQAKLVADLQAQTQQLTQAVMARPSWPTNARHNWKR